MYKIKVFLLYMLLIISTNHAKTSKMDELNACLHEIATKCPEISLEKLLDHDFLEQLAHDPTTLKRCSYVRCIKNKNNFKLNQNKLKPNEQ